MPRHILTPEERARGHQLTQADRIKGGKNVPRAKRAAAALKYPAHIKLLVALGVRYRLTSERARELARLSAQVRRERRAKALASLALGDGGKGAPHTHAIFDPTGAIVQADGCVGDLHALGASLAGKLMARPAVSDEDLASDMAPELFEAPSVDPFTLSALKRLRLEPKSPLSLTRSQRAHVEVMMNAGYVERTPDDFLALTEKGRQAIGAANDD